MTPDDWRLFGIVFLAIATYHAMDAVCGPPVRWAARWTYRRFLRWAERVGGS